VRRRTGAARRLRRLAGKPAGEAAYLLARYRAWAKRVVEEERARRDEGLTATRRVREEALAIVCDVPARLIEEGAARVEEVLDDGIEDDVILLAPTREGPAPIRIAGYAGEVIAWSGLGEWHREIQVGDDGAWRTQLRSLVAAVVAGRCVGDTGTRRPPYRA
jgi:hypothetical protein